MKTALQLLTLSFAVAIGFSGSDSGGSCRTANKAVARAEKEVRQANYANAEKIYRGLIEADSHVKDARLGLSLLMLKQGKNRESFDEAAKVIAADPVNARAHALAGTALLRSGDFRNSIESLYTAVKFNNREAIAIASLAEIEYFENRTRNAYDLLKRSINIDPIESDYYVSLARVCSRLELYTEAADAYQRFLEVSPKTDVERRARIKGLIDFYRYLGTTKIHRMGGKEVASLPFYVVNHRPFVKVMINGKGPLQFVVDTGASLSVISDTVAERMGIKPVAHGGNARAIGGSGTFPIIYGLLESITIGEAKIESVPVYIRTVHTIADTPDEERADGYIGLSVLSNYVVTLDYQNKLLTLDRTTPREEPPAIKPDEENKPGAVKVEPPAPTKPAAGVEIPIRSTSGGLASAETHLPSLDRPLNFIIDTGATVSVISKAAVERHQLGALKLPGQKFRVIGAAGIEEGAEALGLSTLTVNGLRKQNTRALVLDLNSVNETSGFEQHGILGGDYLSHFRVVLDLRRYQFRLTPQSGEISVASDNK